MAGHGEGLLETGFRCRLMLCRLRQQQLAL